MLIRRFLGLGDSEENSGKILTYEIRDVLEDGELRLGGESDAPRGGDDLAVPASAEAGEYQLLIEDVSDVTAGGLWSRLAPIHLTINVKGPG